MPEILEVERYRRLALTTIGRPIAALETPDSWFLKGGVTGDVLTNVLVGHQVDGVRRVGKLLLLDTTSATLGLRFGMTGRLLVDGRAAIERLEYDSDRNEAVWDRFAMRFRDGGDLRFRDPRRLGGVELDPDEEALGVDALGVTPTQLRRALGSSRQAVKARLLDQRRVAGVGNLLVDETLWRAGIDPARPSRDLTSAEHRRLHRHLRRTLDDLLERGGSHTGDLQAARARGAVCPRDGAPLDRRTIGGRTTYSCPVHQS